MDARIKATTYPINNKAAFIVVTRNGHVGPFHPTKQAARDWAKQNNYTLRYSG